MAGEAALQNRSSGRPSCQPGDANREPDGDLLHVGPSRWQLLRRGSTSWCNVREPAASLVAGAALTLIVTGGIVWWLDKGKAKQVNPVFIDC